MIVKNKETPMKKLFIAAIMSVFVGVCLSPVTVEASPSKKYEQTSKKTQKAKKKQVVRKKVIKKYHKKKRKQVAPVKVAAEQNPFVKHCTFLFWKIDCIEGNNQHQEYAGTKVVESSPKKVELAKTPTRTLSSFLSVPASHISAAESMIGLTERDNRQELKSKMSKTFGKTIDPVRIPWCAAWANMVLADAGIQGTNSLMARSFINWGHETHSPKKGDVVVLRRGRNKNLGHVGFYYGMTMVDGIQHVMVLGGNQGKQVAIAYFPISKVIAYRAV